MPTTLLATAVSSAETDLAVTALIVLTVLFGIPVVWRTLRNRSFRPEVRDSRSTDTATP